MIMASKNFPKGGATLNSHISSGKDCRYSHRIAGSAKLVTILVILAVGVAVAIFIRTREPVLPTESAPMAEPAIDVEKVKAQAEGGDPKAQNLLGRAYAKGESVPMDYKEAAKWYQLAADKATRTRRIIWPSSMKWVGV